MGQRFLWWVKWIWVSAIMRVPHTHCTDFKGRLSCMFYQKKKKNTHTKTRIYPQPGMLWQGAALHQDEALKQSPWFGCWTWVAWMCLMTSYWTNRYSDCEVRICRLTFSLSCLHTGRQLYSRIGLRSAVNFRRHTRTWANEFFPFVRAWRPNLKEQGLPTEWLELIKKHYVCKYILLHHSWTYLWI